MDTGKEIANKVGFVYQLCILPKFYFGAAALERFHGFQLGDSTNEWKKKKWDDFQQRLSKLSKESDRTQVEAEEVLFSDIPHVTLDDTNVNNKPSTPPTYR
ncbi:hypothetical protein ZWY2020_004137 [Hordeum vulgare]|nr:hypothetical protein ZWY2020_004137 [Hordeum vulgare]